MTDTPPKKRHEPSFIHSCGQVIVRPPDGPMGRPTDGRLRTDLRPPNYGTNQAKTAQLVQAL